MYRYLGIRFLAGKLMEIADTVIRRRIYILFLQETKWVVEKSIKLNIQDLNYGIQEN